jgi:hypothetical protein
MIPFIHSCIYINSTPLLIKVHLDHGSFICTIPFTRHREPTDLKHVTVQLLPWRWRRYIFRNVCNHLQDSRRITQKTIIPRKGPTSISAMHEREKWLHRSKHFSKCGIVSYLQKVHTMNTCLSVSASKLLDEFRAYIESYSRNSILVRISPINF